VVVLGEPAPPASAGGANAAALAQALAMRMPAPPVLGAEAEVERLLEQAGLAPDPVPDAGRAFRDPGLRLATARAIVAAREALARRDWNEALRRLQQATAEDPDNLTGLLDLGQLLTWLDRGAEGKPLVARAVERYPGDVESIHWYAHTIWDRGHAAAEPLLAAILPERPDDPDLLYDMACARTLDGDMAAAEDYLRRAVRSGYRDWAYMEADPDLRALRESGAFAALMRELRR
jgi:tetratricopeptide (TPR) repeat protein